MKLQIKQRTPDWYELRKTKIGGSDISAIMGDSPWVSPFDLWEIKMGIKEHYINAAMQMGIDNEDIAIKAVEEKLGIKLRPEVHIHDEHHFALASLDGISQGNDVIVEVKSPQRKNHEKYKTVGIPLHYVQQMQWQMMVTGIKSCVFASWCEDELFLKPVVYNDSMSQELVRNAYHFFHDYMVRKKPPKSKDIRHVEIDDPHFYDLEMRFLEIKRQEEEISRMKEDLRKKIVEFSAGINIRGKIIKVESKTTKGRIDENLIMEKGLDPNEFRKPASQSFVVNFI